MLLHECLPEKMIVQPTIVEAAGFIAWKLSSSIQLFLSTADSPSMTMHLGSACSSQSYMAHTR